MMSIKRWSFRLGLPLLLAVLMHGWLEARVQRAWQSLEAELADAGLALQVEHAPALVWRPMPRVVVAGLVIGPADGGLPWVRIDRLVWMPPLGLLTTGQPRPQGELVLSGLRGRLPVADPAEALTLLHHMAAHPVARLPDRIRVESLDLSLGDASGLRLDGVQARSVDGRWTLSGALRRPGRLDLSIEAQVSPVGEQWRLSLLAVGRQTEPQWAIDWQRIDLSLVGQPLPRGWRWTSIQADASLDLRLPTGGVLGLESKLALEGLDLRPEGMSLAGAQARFSPRRDSARIGASWRADAAWSAADRRFSLDRVEFDATGNEAARQSISHRGIRLSRGQSLLELPLTQWRWDAGRSVRMEFGSSTTRLGLELRRQSIGWHATLRGQGLDLRTLPSELAGVHRLADPLTLLQGMLRTWPDGASIPISLAADFRAIHDTSRHWERLQLRARLDRQRLSIDRLQLQDARWRQTWQASLGLHSGQLDVATQVRGLGAVSDLPSVGPVRRFSLDARLAAQGLDPQRWHEDLRGRTQVQWRGASAAQRAEWTRGWRAEWRHGARFPWEVSVGDAR